jgi:hypothetical protein
MPRIAILNAHVGPEEVHFFSSSVILMARQRANDEEEDEDDAGVHALSSSSLTQSHAGRLSRREARD